jgi:ribosomal protein S18 acetylase RimI-like enzyme
MSITYHQDLNTVDWEALKQDLIADDFHNGRTTDQLRLSFENSQHVVMGFDEGRCIANGRMLSDGVGNAYVIDVWTRSDYRNRGVATEVMRRLIAAVPGQHIYLQTDDAVDFYLKLGFQDQPRGLSAVSGEYLKNQTRGD